MSGERLNVFATRMTLTMMKGRVKGAQQGHKLLTMLFAAGQDHAKQADLPSAPEV